MDDPELISSKVRLTLDLPPSCIQFCPAHPELFVVGTYNLEKNGEDAQQSKPDDDSDPAAATKTPQSRNGSLLVFKVDGAELHLVQTVSQPSAILDLRFHPFKDKQDILAVVSSTGTLTVFKLDPVTNLSFPLQHISTSRCDDIGEDVLFLQCNWHPEIPSLIGVTTSTSSARLLLLDQDYRITDQYTDLNIPNSLEAWCIAFSSGTPDSNQDKAQVSAYCGGDDSMLRYTSCIWDSNEPDSPCQEPFSPITIKGTHNAGVTAVLPLPLFIKDNGRVVVTGSYDDHLRVFIIHDLHETYGMKKVELVLEENLGGGVWRLDLVRIQKGTDSTKLRILVSCMHAGTRLVDLEVKQEKDWTCKVLAKFEEHKSMNYGSDFVRDNQAGERLRCVSTSFYDKLLCLWEYEP
ncbi:WD repeat-containing protein 85 like protein [Fusarium austroafricanum]|uniref:WD repeat-containing protein 85 like protein n=1 Tax=Fusarium austroafricanum TaxID=2364996 RepID=A0A8H4PA97_9HYPO|nr:WD repeat-containing protein 85 like protein [Fusarium austroafricanum]